MNKPKYNKDNKKKPSYPKSNKPKRVNDGNNSSSKSTDNVHVSGDINDSSYYFSDELLKVQLGTVSFNDFTGVPITLSGSVVDNIPYAMRVYLNPSAGFTPAQDVDSHQTAINLAGLQTYTMLTSSNAKTSNYGPQDITTLFLAVGSLISMISYARRAFGSVYNYSLRNRTYPEKIINAMGVNYEDLVANMANYRVRFNADMNQISKVPIPGNISYFKKCHDIYSGLYLDMMGSPMAQTYVFVPESTWLLDETGSEEGTVLKTITICDSAEPDVLNSMEFILTQIERQIKAITESSTFNKIYADILRLNNVGSMPLWSFDLLPDNYVVLPEYNAEIRKWINNLTIMGKPLSAPGETYTELNNVYPDADTNRVVYRPQFEAIASAAYLDRIMNFDYGTYTIDDIIYATRLTSGALYALDSTVNKFRTTELALPDFYVTAITMYAVNETSLTVSRNFLFGSEVTTITSMSDFDWHPILPVVTTAGTLTALYGDLNYYTTLNFNYLRALQDATYFGLFEVR